MDSVLFSQIVCGLGLITEIQGVAAKTTTDRTNISTTVKDRIFFVDMINFLLLLSCFFALILVQIVLRELGSLECGF